MKKTISILLCAVLLICTLAVSVFAADVNRVTVTANKTQVFPGEEVMFTVAAESRDASNMFGVLLDFDRDLFEFVSGSATASYLNENGEEMVFAKNVNKEADKEGVAVVFSEAVTYSGEVGRFVLRAKDVAELTDTVVGVKVSAMNGTSNVTYETSGVEVTAVPGEAPAETTEPTVPATEPTVPATENRFVITADKTDVFPGDTIVFTVTAAFAEKCDQFGLLFAFDTEVFEFVRGGVTASYQDEFGLEMVAFKNFNSTPGKEGVAVSFAEPVTYAGNVCKFIMKVKEGAEFTNTAVNAIGSAKLSTDTLKVEISEVTITKHVHRYVDHAAQAPGCDAIGWNAYQTCEGCDYTTYEELPATGHTWVDYAAVAPTCDTEGNIAYQQCSVCGAAQTMGENPIPLGRYGWIVAANGHAYVNHEAKAPTCEGIGWDAYQTCENCDYTTYSELPANGHAYVDHEAKAPTCEGIGWDAYQTCENCDYTTYSELPAAGHAYVDHEAKAPTCEGIGWDAYQTCENCDYTTYSELPANGHAYVNHEAKAPTCEGIGWDAYQTCENCDYTTYNELPATGHNFVDGGCTQCNYRPGDFTDDGKVDNDDVVLLLWHTLFPQDYPIGENADLTGDGKTDNDDVVLLLWHTLFPQDYPLIPKE